MVITTKELRLQPGKIIEQVVSGKEIVVTFRGKPLARIVPFSASNSESDDEDIFGLWKNHDKIENVDSFVRTLRKGRKV
jgi:prevent-host-death family protein